MCGSSPAGCAIPIAAGSGGSYPAESSWLCRPQFDMSRIGFIKIDTIDTIDTDFLWINLFWENYVKWMMPPWKEIMFLPVEETAMAMICSPTQLDDQREISYYS